MVAAARAVATRIVAVASASIITAVTAVASAATAMGGLQLLGSGIAHHSDFAFEADILTCEWMVEIHLYVSVGNFGNHTVDPESVGCHHREYSSGVHHVGIEFAIHFKNVAGQGCNLFGVMLSECFISFYG